MAAPAPGNFASAWRERNQLLLAQLYRETGRAADAARVEHTLAQELAFSDADNPLLRQVSAPSAATRDTTAQGSPRS